jgi:protein-disulfide isomerase
VPVTSNDPTWGNADAPVTLVEFSDFQCPFCARAGETMGELRQLFGPGSLRMVWKNYPLPFHPNARPAAEAAMIVFALGGASAFWKFHDLVFDNQRTISAANYRTWAVAAGVDGERFQAALSARSTSAKVDEDAALATRLGITGTPVFRINGIPIMGSQPIDRFKEIIEDQLAAAKELTAKGTPASQIYAVLSARNAAAAAAAQARAAAQPESEDTAAGRVPAAEGEPMRVPALALSTLVPSKDNPTKGSAKAKVTVQIFGDFECPFCQRVEPTLAQLERHFAGRVRFVWRNYPLPFHENAALAAEAAQEVFAQKGAPAFWAYHDLLFAAQTKGGLERANLERLAQKLGMDVKRFRSALDTRRHRPVIDKDIEVAKKAEFDGIPVFVINGYLVIGAQPLAAFERTVERALAEAETAPSPTH